MKLPDTLTPPGDYLLWFETIDSTMDEARRQWQDALSSRLWIVAGEQQAGRGRQARPWHSPVGNLHLTLVLPTRILLRDQPKLSFVAGVALARAVASLLSTEASIRLKWPNDLLLDGAKVSGLLLEGLGQGRAVALGMGINIVAHPPETPYPATHLQVAAPEITAQSLFTALSLSLVEELDLFADGSGFALTRQRWLARAAHLGQPLQVRQGEIVIEGVFKDLDLDGRLLLETTQGLLRIDAGDVFPLDK